MPRAAPEPNKAPAAGLEPAHRDAGPVEQDVRDLMDQIQGGIALCEQILDQAQPGWNLNSKSKGRDHAAWHARSLLSTAWINLGTTLLRDHGVEPWTIAPLGVRGSTSHTTQWTQFGVHGDLDVTEDESSGRVDRPLATEPVRTTERPRERLYTLAQARELLDARHEHTWEVETDEAGQPVAVRCSHMGCTERRSTI